jgi:DNA-binding winged helix-turn-helix (wHTH) protein
MLRESFVVSSKPSTSSVFGDCVFDHEARVLTRRGRAVPLSPKAYELLAALLAARPRALSKQELQDRLWPATFVSHTSLPRVMAEVRKAIGDARRDARFIRTLHGFGYAFCGEATATTREPVPGAPAAPRCGVVFKKREIELSDGDTLIGRGHDCGLRFDLAAVSRHHALLRVREGRASIEDLGSKNGTAVNGRPVSGRIALADGSEIVLGTVVLVFRIWGPGRSTKTAAR